MEDGGWRILGNNDRMADGGDGGVGGERVFLLSRTKNS